MEVKIPLLEDFDPDINVYSACHMWNELYEVWLPLQYFRFSDDKKFVYCEGDVSSLYVFMER